MNHPLAGKISRDDVLGVLTVNGIKISYELLGAITESTPPNTWLRLRRDGDTMVVVQATAPIEEDLA